MSVVNAKELLSLFISNNHEILSKANKPHSNRRLFFYVLFWTYSVKLKSTCNVTFNRENFGLIQNIFKKMKCKFEVC